MAQTSLFPGTEEVPRVARRRRNPPGITIVSPYVVRIVTASTCPREQDRLLEALDKSNFEAKLAAAAQELLERVKALSSCVAEVQH